MTVDCQIAIGFYELCAQVALICSSELIAIKFGGIDLEPDAPPSVRQIVRSNLFPFAVRAWGMRSWFYKKNVLIITVTFIVNPIFLMKSKFFLHFDSYAIENLNAILRAAVFRWSIVSCTYSIGEPLIFTK